MRRTKWRSIVVSALTLVALGATPVSTAAPASGQQVADVTVAFESRYTSDRDEIYAFPSGCGGARGTIDKLDTNTLKTAFKAKLLRSPTGRGYAYALFRPSDGSGRAGIAVRPRYQRTTVTALQIRRLDDDDACVVEPSPANGTTEQACALQLRVVFLEERGRVQMPFAPNRDDNECTETGYPGRTNYLRPVGRVAPGKLSSRRRNVITATQSKRFTAAQDGADVAQIDSGTWKLTLLRTSAWKRYGR